MDYATVRVDELGELEVLNVLTFSVRDGWSSLLRCNRPLLQPFHVLMGAEAAGHLFSGLPMDGCSRMARVYLRTNRPAGGCSGPDIRGSFQGTRCSGRGSKSAARKQLARIIHQYPGTDKELLKELITHYINSSHTQSSTEQLPQYTGTSNEQLDADISESEVCVALHELRTTSAPGPDGVTNKTLRNLWSTVSGGHYRMHK
ncbi:hypothetical protein MTO96_035319 [Rhipicephalus appendiculatus]